MQRLFDQGVEAVETSAPIDETRAQQGELADRFSNAGTRPSRLGDARTRTQCGRDWVDRFGARVSDEPAFQVKCDGDRSDDIKSW